jgi:tripartite-type tricarboxylate transporter receptor subunit TctC
MRRASFIVMIALLAAPLFGVSPSSAQSSPQAWPTRNVKFIVTLGPGSGTDIGGRLLADRLTKKWGHAVVIENRPGGDGIVAINAFVSAKDDHVLLLTPTSSFIAHPWMHENRPYKTEDLAPIARVSNTVIGISVPSELPVKSLPELVALAKSKPGELNWAGVTGALDFNFAGWLKIAGLDMKKVPYRNPVEAANDLAESPPTSRT